MTCGPSASGKTSWIETNCGGYHRVSLDEIREEVTGRRGDQSQNGKVLQEAKGRLRGALRKKENVVWEATSLREDGRAMVLRLGCDYHALTRTVAFAVPPDELEKRNRKRANPVPQSVLEKQLASMEWPSPWEAHEFSTVS